MASRTSTLTYVLQARINNLEAGLNRANTKLSSFQRTSSNITRNIQSNLAAAFSIGAAIAFGKATFDLILKLDGVNRALKAVAGSSAEFQRAKMLLSITSEKYGANVLDLTEAYTKFTAATKGSTLSTRELDGIFTSITKSAGVLGLSAEQTEGTFKALEQMFSKGTVAAEEIRGQLSERLPGAFTILAKSMGITTEELNKQLKLGNVLADDVLPKFVLEYEKAVGANAVKKVTTLRSEIERFKNDWIESLDEVNDKASLLQRTLSYINDKHTVGRGKRQGKLEGVDMNQSLSKLADIVREKDEEALVSARRLAEGQKAALKTIFDAYVTAGKGADDFLETQKLMRKYNLSDALEPSQITEVLGMFDSFTKSMDDGLQSLKDASVVLPDTLNSLNAELDDLKSQRMGALSSQISGIDSQITALQEKIENFGKTKRKLGAAPEVQSIGIGDMFSPEKTEIALQQQTAFYDQSLDKAYDYAMRMKEQMDAMNMILEGTIENMMIGVAEAIGSGNFDQIFSGILETLAQGIIDMGKLLVQQGVMLKAFQNVVEPGAKIAIGLAAIAVGSAFMAASARLGNSASGGGGRGASGGGRGFTGQIQGQSLSDLDGKFRVEGQDLVLVLSNHANKNVRNQLSTGAAR